MPGVSAYEGGGNLDYGSHIGVPSRVLLYKVVGKT